MRIVNTEWLRVAYLEDGPQDGWPVILLHGFPYDVHAFDEVVPTLTKAGAHVVRPYCRGFGPTRFQSAAIMRSGQQVARALDVIHIADALRFERPILAGFDWGGNASCAAAAIWPERIGGLVSYAGYDVIDVTQQREPLDPHLERTCWYQHLFQTERGRKCLDDSRMALCRILWRDWSPQWPFSDDLYNQSAAAFDNPDFVEVVIHCYRWMFGAVMGDPALQALENQLAEHPAITVPTVTLDGTSDPLKPGGTADHASLFTGKHEHRSVTTGHNLPQEAPDAFAQAVLKVRSWITGEAPFL